MGDRGYMGQCYNTFKNVMMSISNNLKEKKITLFLYNSTNTQNINHKRGFNEILTILSDYEIKIIMF